MTLLANQNLVQVRTRCHSALPPSREDVDREMCFLAVSRVVPCLQGVRELRILTLCS